MTNANTVQKIGHYLENLQSGDTVNVDHLLQLSYKRLQVFARRQLNHFPTVRKYDETQDVLHDVWVRIMAKVKSQPPESASAFFMIVSSDIRNHLIDQLRRLIGRNSDRHGNENDGTRPNRDKLNRSDQLAISLAEHNTYDPRKILLWSEFHETVNGLATDLRQVTDLIFYQGLSQEVAASVLGVTRKVVRNRWREAKLILAQVLPENVETTTS